MNYRKKNQEQKEEQVYFFLTRARSLRRTKGGGNETYIACVDQDVFSASFFRFISSIAFFQKTTAWTF